MLADPNLHGFVGGNGGGKHPPYFFPSNQFRTVYGSPSEVTIQWGGVSARWRLWKLHATGYDYVSTEFLLPDYYAGEDIDFSVFWAKEDSGSGDWHSTCNLVGLAEGEIITSGGTLAAGNTTITVPATVKALVKTTQVLTSPALDAGDLLLFMAGRAGSAGADTYAGDILFMYALLDW